MFNLYRSVLGVRRSLESQTYVDMLDLGPSLVGFRRGDVVCATNFSGDPAIIPCEVYELVASSVPISLLDGRLVMPPDATAWYRHH